MVYQIFLVPKTTDHSSRSVSPKGPLVLTGFFRRPTGFGGLVKTNWDPIFLYQVHLKYSIRHQNKLILDNSIVTLCSYFRSVRIKVHTYLSTYLTLTLLLTYYQHQHQPSDWERTTRFSSTTKAHWTAFLNCSFGILVKAFSPSWDGDLHLSTSGSNAVLTSTQKHGVGHEGLFHQLSLVFCIDVLVAWSPIPANYSILPSILNNSFPLQ